MLLIHWSKQNNTGKILKNGITPSKRKTDEGVILKGVWCYPFSRNKSLNGNWRTTLKRSRRQYVNFNGFVFKLEPSDFPLYAGEFGSIRVMPKLHQYENYEHFLKDYGTDFSPQRLANERNEQTLNEGWLDLDDFEIILPNRIDPKRIIRVIKDREPRKKDS